MPRLFFGSLSANPFVGFALDNRGGIGDLAKHPSLTKLSAEFHSGVTSDSVTEPAGAGFGTFFRENFNSITVAEAIVECFHFAIDQKSSSFGGQVTVDTVCIVERVGTVG